MPEPTIVPPVPVVNQGEPIDTSPGIEAVQRIFDQVIPQVHGEPGKKDKQPAKAAEEPKEPVAPTTEPVKEPVSAPPEATKQPSDERHPGELPSFLEEALKGAPGQAAPPAEDEWPEELPAFKTPEESKARYKKWRDSYGKLKTELTTLREKPTLNAEQLNRLEFLEGQNRQMQEVLTRVGVEQSAEFQNNILRPLHQAWNEAARIVNEAGGDPQSLAKAMSLNGKAQFEALDELFSEMPESAKLEAHDALRTYRRFEDARKAAIANAPAALEGIRKRETERQFNMVKQQQAEMRNIFDAALEKLKADKVEVFLKTDSPEGKWWNEQNDKIVQQSRELYLENTDLNRVAVACLLAPAADAYRKLWLNSQKTISELKKVISERISSEPNLTENGGPGSGLPPDRQIQEDLKKPFADVFLREFHKAQSGSRR